MSDIAPITSYNTGFLEGAAWGKGTIKKEVALVQEHSELVWETASRLAKHVLLLEKRYLPLFLESK